MSLTETIAKLQPCRTVRRTLWSAAAVASLATLPAARLLAADFTYRLRPLDYGNGVTLDGTIVTNRARGLLTAANVVRWHIVVTQTSQLDFTPVNTRPLLNQVTATRKGLLVAGSPDGQADGGTLTFWGGRRLGTQVADFTGPAAAGGQAFYVYGADFGYQGLNQLPGATYEAARAVGRGRYELVPVDFGAGITMTGTIVTDGFLGALTAAHIRDWDIRIVHRDTLATFTEADSRVMAIAQVRADGPVITVTNPNGTGPVTVPGGILEIGRFRYDLTAALLADFTDPTIPGGQAAYYDPMNLYTISPLSRDPRYVVARLAGR